MRFTVLPGGILQIELEFGNVGFWREGKTGVPGEKNFSDQGRGPTTNSTHTWRRVRESNPGHIGGRRVLSPLRHPCSLGKWYDLMRISLNSGPLMPHSWPGFRFYPAYHNHFISVTWFYATCSVQSGSYVNRQNSRLKMKIAQWRSTHEVSGCVHVLSNVRTVAW